MGLSAYFRLLRAGYVLAREGALSVTEGQGIKGPAARAIKLARLIERRSVRKTGHVERLSKALQKLGPTYVKLGQMLATRPDIVGAHVSADLQGLQDQMPPFDQRLVPKILKQSLGSGAERLLDISEPIAAASIAQVHQAHIEGPNGRQKVAVKLLRLILKSGFIKISPPCVRRRAWLSAWCQNRVVCGH